MIHKSHFFLDGGGCTYGDIRLASQHRGRSDGRVEVCYNNEWGTVCNNGWDSNDALVACKQLGYTAYYNYYYYSGGSGYIWLNNLDCSGSETSLFDCPKSLGHHVSCVDYQDVSVNCYCKFLF